MDLRGRLGSHPMWYVVGFFNPYLTTCWRCSMNNFQFILLTLMKLWSSNLNLLNEFVTKRYVNGGFHHQPTNSPKAPKSWHSQVLKCIICVQIFPNLTRRVFYLLAKLGSRESQQEGKEESSNTDMATQQIFKMQDTDTCGIRQIKN